MTRGIPMSAAELNAFIGMKFGRLEILSISREVGMHAIASCRCDCGEVKNIRALHVLSGAQVSCGCARRETIHGKAGTSIYGTWRAMRARCENPRDAGYPCYGGRGISVCERWESFENFYADMGDRPPDASIDRIDVNGNYEPANCRWATAIEQANNTRRNRIVTFRGKKMSLAQAKTLSGLKISRSGLHGRLERGWDIERALSAAPGQKTGAA